MACLMEVIWVGFRRGDGSDSDPRRRVRQFWLKDGNLLIENDPWTIEQMASLVARVEEFEKSRESL